MKSDYFGLMGQSYSVDGRHLHWDSVIDGIARERQPLFFIIEVMKVVVLFVNALLDRGLFQVQLLLGLAVELPACTDVLQAVSYRVSLGFKKFLERRKYSDKISVFLSN